MSDQIQLPGDDDYDADGDLIEAIAQMSPAERALVAKLVAGLRPAAPEERPLAPAREGSNGQAGGLHLGPAALEAGYATEIRAVRQGDVEAISRIKEKYRKLGLQVY